MCFGVNKYGQMFDLGFTGQYAYRLNQYQPSLPSLFQYGILSQQHSYKPTLLNNSLNTSIMTCGNSMSKLLEQIKKTEVLLPSQKSGWGGIYER